LEALAFHRMLIVTFKNIRYVDEEWKPRLNWQSCAAIDFFTGKDIIAGNPVEINRAPACQLQSKAPHAKPGTPNLTSLLNTSNPSHPSDPSRTRCSTIT